LSEPASGASTSGYGLFEISPFESAALQLPDGTRVQAQTGGSNIGVIAHTLPRANFETLGASMLAVLQVMTRTDWHLVLYDAVLTNGRPLSLYFYALLIFGNYFLMNVFVAMVIVGFGKQVSASHYLYFLFGRRIH
jgi:hypothetical protein